MLDQLQMPRGWHEGSLPALPPSAELLAALGPSRHAAAQPAPAPQVRLPAFCHLLMQCRARWYVCQPAAPHLEPLRSCVDRASPLPSFTMKSSSSASRAGHATAGPCAATPPAECSCCGRQHGRTPPSPRRRRSRRRRQSSRRSRGQRSQGPPMTCHPNQPVSAARP